MSAFRTTHMQMREQGGPVRFTTSSSPRAIEGNLEEKANFSRGVFSLFRLSALVHVASAVRVTILWTKGRAQVDAEFGWDARILPHRSIP